MLIDIRHLNVPVSDALYEFTKRRIARALRPFEEAVSRIDVRTKNVNGPRGVPEVECRMTVGLASVEHPVTITCQGADAYATILSACAHLHESVSQALESHRRTQGSDRAPTIAMPQQHTPTASAPEKVTADSFGRPTDIVVTAMDQERLRRLIQASREIRDRDAADALADELDRAEVVPAERIAGSVVTMNSKIVFKDEGTGESREVSLVYPQDSDPGQGRISIFAPVGTALLGLAVGQTIDWPLPRGELKRYRVMEVVYQPEAAGHLHL
jgi:regulator of nucleoside diphosphate kinase